MAFFSESFKRFIDILSSDEHTTEVSQRALEAVAGELNLGRMTVNLSVPQNRYVPEGQNESLLLYRWEGRCAPERGRDWEVHTGDGGDAVFRAEPRADAPQWTAEDAAALDALVDILKFHCGRFRLIGRIEHSLLTQYLTGLPNSGGFLKRCSEYVQRGDIFDYDSYYFNLRGTSIMNVKFGQREADEIIKRYCRAMEKAMDSREILGHLGGDNLVALVRRENSERFRALLDGLQTYAETPKGRVPVLVSATAGAMHLTPEQFPGEWILISGPIIAWRHAKAQGQHFVMLTRSLIEASNRARMVENTFYDALYAGEFQPFYQPKVDMLTGRIVGAEVLSRWIRDGRIVAPLEFIPVLERTGEITDLDLYILEEACKDIARWRTDGHDVVPLSVNISRRDLETPDLVDRIMGCFQKYDIRQNEMLIEITETANERESSMMKRFVDSLLLRDIMTSIDDFGTGYSSLSFLRDLPVHELKIDRSFINHPVLSEKDRVIIGNIIDTARRLGVDVITEGVENRDQVRFLLELGCVRAQGFLYDRPLPREEFRQRLLQGHYSI